MPTKISFSESLKLKSRDLIPIKCEECGGTAFQKKHHIIKVAYSSPEAETLFSSIETFCSRKCLGIYRDKKRKVECLYCGREFLKLNAECIRTPKHYCSHSCSAKSSNKNKTTGFNRSKLEFYIEKELLLLFPNLEVICNDRKEIGYELDFFIPSLRLAFELNGIFHYEPIYGTDKLDKTKFNDSQKFGLCRDKLISLCVIDTTSLKYFKEGKAKEFLDIIVSIIKEKMAPAPSIEEG